MVRIKSDGNGGTHIQNIKPAWVAIFLTIVMMFFSIGSFVFGYGTKSEKIDRLEKQMEIRRQFDDKVSDCIIDIKSDISETKSDVKWIKEHLKGQ